MQARRNGKYDVAAVELAAWQQVKRSGEHSDPRGSGDRMQRERGELHSDVQQSRSQMESQWESQLNFRRCGTGDGMRERDADEQGRASWDESGDRPGDSDVEERGA